jgi:dethiobiotin synthetase
MTSLFVTGTDTGVGKTVIACALIHALAQQGCRVAGMKPVASGCEATPEGLRNADALALQAAANVRTRYEDVNPYAFAPAIAPHIAAGESGQRIELEKLERAYQRLALVSDVVVVEGAGGWLTPIDALRTLADFATGLDAHVVLVVGLRLGCLNHAMLTERAIAAAGATCIGWVGNLIDPGFERLNDNLRTLETRLRGPCLGVLDHQPARRPADTAALLDGAAVARLLGLAWHY